MEVDITQKPRESIKILNHRGEMLEQSIHYEWRPQYCHTCLKIGHDCSIKQQESKHKHKVWKPVASKPLKPIMEENMVEDTTPQDCTEDKL